MTSPISGTTILLMSNCKDDGNSEKELIKLIREILGGVTVARQVIEPAVEPVPVTLDKRRLRRAVAALAQCRFSHDWPPPKCVDRER